jgi:hypothetical protein
VAVAGPRRFDTLQEEPVMRKTPILALAALALFLATGSRPAAAQDILGLSLRPTDEMPAGTARGTVDLVSEAGGQTNVHVDVSGAAESLKLEDHPGASAFVVWAVDNDGVRHNIGTLDEALVLADASVPFLVAKIYVTAEADAEAASPTGEQLFEATLRNVTEVEAPPAAAATGAPAAAAPAPTEAPAAEKPKVLPTTGAALPDGWVLAALALGLLAFGAWLRFGRA